MTTSEAPCIEVAELNQLLQAVDPRVLLVPPRLLRRVIKRDRAVTGLGLQVPHRRSYVISQRRLLRIAGPAELGLGSTEALPETVILMALPSPRTLSGASRGDILVKYWRTLFHARVHLTIQDRFMHVDIEEGGIRERIAHIGEAEFDEIRAVLRQDEYLLPPRDDRTVYEEFAALYLELRFFANSLLASYFPGLPRLESIDKLLARDIDAEALFIGTRPADAPEPTVREDREHDDSDAQSLSDNMSQALGEPSFELFRKLIRRAKGAAKKGNQVRAAIARQAAASVAPPEQREEAWRAAVGELRRLATRLQAALALSGRDADRWARALESLLAPASHGIWPVEARLLYDLQKICIDHEREVYAVDLIDWLVSFGRRSLKRPLPCQREVRILRHLRAASRHLKSARLMEADRRRLASLLRDAIWASEKALRDRFRPLIRQTLEEIGMLPQNVPEEVALNKLIEELLDIAQEHGYLTMGDLRDAISHNNLKLPDLAGPSEFLFGDRLLRANRRLAHALDGVYRPGEIYLRWLQRLSSVAFGTRVGRFVTRYLALPFGGAFVLLEGLEHVFHPLARLLLGMNIHLMTPRLEQRTVTAVDLLRDATLVGVLGTFFLGLLYVEWFRKSVTRGLWLLYRGLRGILIDFPAWILRLPVVRRVLASTPVVLFRAYAMKPLLAAGLTWLLLSWLGADTFTTRRDAGLVFLAVAAFLNTPLGRDFEETVVDWLVRTWQRLHFDLLPGLFRVVMGAFKSIVEGVDRLLYRVDEWLRFRAGEGWLALIAKPILGLVWFCIAYIIRFCINLLIEPQINPIKHFPVVTVSHKLVLGLFVPPFARVLTLTMDRRLAGTVALTVGFGIPGIFGFLVWELKENWKLYRANRSPTLRPVVIGHHGETMLRFLRPGFHSGTLPKLFTRLRRAERSAQRTGDWRSARKHRANLHLVEEGIRNFTEREFICLLTKDRAWVQIALSAGTIRMATNRIRIDLVVRELGEQPLGILFEERAGWLAAGIAHQGWLPKLSTEHLHAFTIALAGFYKMAGVDLVHEQIDAGLALDRHCYRISSQGILLRTGGNEAKESSRDLRNGIFHEGSAPDGAGRIDLAAPSANLLVFRNVPIYWEDWVATWQDGEESEQLKGKFLKGFCLLPRMLSPTTG